MWQGIWQVFVYKKKRLRLPLDALVLICRHQVTAKEQAMSASVTEISQFGLGSRIVFGGVGVFDVVDVSRRTVSQPKSWTLRCDDTDRGTMLRLTEISGGNYSMSRHESYIGEYGWVHDELNWTRTGSLSSLLQAFGRVERIYPRAPQMRTLRRR